MSHADIVVSMVSRRFAYAHQTSTSIRHQTKYYSLPLPTTTTGLGVSLSLEISILINRLFVNNSTRLVPAAALLLQNDDPGIADRGLSIVAVPLLLTFCWCRVT